MKQNLRGQWSVITGASSGLGEQYARQLAAEGANLLLAARRIDRLEKLATELAKNHAVSVRCLQIDLSKSGSAASLFQEATKLNQPVTLLINNAGIGPYGRFVDGKLEKFTETLQLNAVTLTEACHLFARHMIEHGKPSYISNIASLAAFQGTPNFAVYAGTKSYVRIFSEILALELKNTNVTVNCVCPGGVSTEFSGANGQVVKDFGQSMMMSAEAVVRQGLASLFARQVVVVPGLLNKLAAFLPRLLPSTFALKMAQSTMEKSVSVALPDSTDTRRSS